MANLWYFTLFIVIGVLTVESQTQNLAAFLKDSTSEKLTVFQKGEFQVTKPIMVRNAPQPLLILSPKEAGVYPVLLFIHGTMLSNEDYLEFFKHIASHGFIVVAPKLFGLWLPSHQEEIDMAASVANWLPANLEKVFENNKVVGVEGDMDKLAVSGHSRGGKTAFALALGLTTKNTKLSVKISALIGVDPVAGSSKEDRTKPYVLSYKQDSINLSIPVTVIGSGLGNQSLPLLPSCAPNNVNHQQFYDECKQSSHFVISRYGHVDMLNEFKLDPIAVAMSLVCKPSFLPKATMRRTLGGIMVAFLNTYFRGDGGQYNALIHRRSLAPTKLFVENKGNRAPPYYFAST